MVTGGSSPLARGTLARFTNQTVRLRLIPARAGNTPGQTLANALDPAHPRSRGEHTFQVLALIVSSGSSPLARGTLLVSAIVARKSRLIPARAGNTALTGTRSPTFTAHPRSRGEHAFEKATGYDVFGSSPLARGTPGYTAGVRGSRRLIPARAGNTKVPSG